MPKDQDVRHSIHFPEHAQTAESASPPSKIPAWVSVIDQLHIVKKRIQRETEPIPTGQHKSNPGSYSNVLYKLEILRIALENPNLDPHTKEKIIGTIDVLTAFISHAQKAT